MIKKANIIVINTFVFAVLCIVIFESYLLIGQFISDDLKIYVSMIIPVVQSVLLVIFLREKMVNWFFDFFYILVKRN